MYLNEKSFSAPPVESKPDIYALPTFIAWLEKQPADRSYSWWDCHGRCLLGQYMWDHGMAWYEGGVPYSVFVDHTKEATGFDWQDIAAEAPYTMGAALTRAKALLP